MMTRIHAVGVSPELVAFLERRLQGVEVTATQYGHEALAALAQGGSQLLVIDHHVTNPPALELLAEMRKLPAGANLPVICCLEEGASSELQMTLVGRFGVEQICFHPLDPEELARRASERLNLSLRSQPQQQTQAQDQALAAVAGLWTRFKGTILGRVEVVEQALSELLEGDLSNELRQKAEQEAHKLAGSVGSFGFKEGSRLAREIERFFRAGSTLEQSQALPLSEMAEALRRELESRPIGQPAGSSVPMGDSRPLLLVVDSDKELAQKLAEEAGSREVRAEVANELSAAREFLGRCRPDVVLLDLSFPQDARDSLQLLEELAAHDPAVPTLVLTARDRDEAKLHGVESVDQLAQVAGEQPAGVRRAFRVFGDDAQESGARDLDQHRVGFRGHRHGAQTADDERRLADDRRRRQVGRPVRRRRRGRSATRPRRAGTPTAPPHSPKTGGATPSMRPCATPTAGTATRRTGTGRTIRCRAATGRTFRWTSLRCR